jgi:hypothetical protein
MDLNGLFFRVRLNHQDLFFLLANHQGLDNLTPFPYAAQQRERTV